MAHSNSLQPVVVDRDGDVVATSLDVARYFGKRHDNVLQDIGELLKSLTPQISGVWFRSTSYRQKVGFGSRANPAYEMTKDGFTLLAMGFTGPKALAFKIAYIEAFNAMEAQIAAARPGTIGTDEEVRSMLFSYANRIGELEDKLALASTAARPADRDQSHSISETARHIGIRPMELFDYLRSNRWIVKDPDTGGYVPSVGAIACGWMILFKDVVRQWDGGVKIRTQPRILQEGAMFLVQDISAD